MSTDLSEITQKLEAEELRLQQLLTAAQEETKTIAADLKRIQLAHTALSGRKATGRGVPKKPAVSLEKVQEFIADVTSISAELSEEELKKRVSTKVVDAGFALTGFALRFKNALRKSSAAKPQPAKESNP